MTALHHFLFLWFVCFNSSLKEENPFSEFSFTKYAAERTLPTHTLNISDISISIQGWMNSF